MNIENNRQYIIRPLVFQGAEYDGIYVDDQGNIFPGTYMPNAETVDGRTVESVQINPGFEAVAVGAVEIIRPIAWPKEKA